MTGLPISEVALRVGLNSSAIRYYERVGLLHPPRRVSGQRRYDPAEIDRLCVIRRARQLGFTLGEVRELFGTAPDREPVAIWRGVSNIKLAELEEKIEKIKVIQRDLKSIVRKCQCRSLEECGRKMRAKLAESEAGTAGVKG